MLKCIECHKISFNIDINGMCKNCVNYYLDIAQDIITNKIEPDAFYSTDKKNSIESRKIKIKSAHNKFEKMLAEKSGIVANTYHRNTILQLENGINKAEKDIDAEIEKINRKNIEIENAKNVKLHFYDVLNKYLTDIHTTVPPGYDRKIYREKEFDCILRGIARHNIVISNSQISQKDTSDYEYKSKNITVKTNVSKYKNFVVIDTETTGLRTHNNHIIEISAIKFEEFTPVEIFTTLINPKIPIPKASSCINRITDNMVANSPTFPQINEDLSAFISNYPIVAHNAEFDIKFLLAEGLLIDTNKMIIYDTLDMSRKTFKGLYNYKLSTVCNDRYICFDGAHRSSSDALATGLLFIEILKEKLHTANILSLLK